MTQYLYKDVDDFLKDLADNQDFDCNKISSNKRKLIFINELKEKCGCIGVTLQNELNDEDKLKYMNQYNTIFRNRDKTINMNNLVNLRKLFIKTLRNLFSSKYLISKQVGKTRTYEYDINNEFVDYHRNLYKFRESKRNITPVPTKKLF